MNARYSYHGRRMPEWQAYAMPDQMVIADHSDPSDEPMGVLVVRRRTEQFVPVPPSIHRLGRVVRGEHVDHPSPWEKAS